MKRYKINEIFYSLQGEGMRAGEASVFVRFSGCNLKCAMEPGPKSPGGFDCDTEFESGRMMTAEEIASEIEAVLIAGGSRPEQMNSFPYWIVFTGGEPALQLDKALVDYLHVANFKLAIETNGTVNVDDLGLDWITVSPKVAEHALQQLKADEVKYVRGYGQSIPKTRVEARYKLVSPAFDGVEVRRADVALPGHNSLAWCIQLVKANPEWRLSVQLHKAWGVR